MNIYDEIVKVEDDTTSNRMLSDQMCLVVDTTRNRYWIEDVTVNESRQWDYERSSYKIKTFYISLFHRELFSQFMNGEHRTRDLQRQMLMQIKSKDNNLSEFSRFVISNFDKKFKNGFFIPYE